MENGAFEQCLLLNMGIFQLAMLVYQSCTFHPYISKITRVHGSMLTWQTGASSSTSTTWQWLGVRSKLSINGIAQLKGFVFKTMVISTIKCDLTTYTTNLIIQAMYPSKSWEQSGLARQGDANSLHQTLWHPNTSPWTHVGATYRCPDERLQSKNTLCLEVAFHNMPLKIQIPYRIGSKF